MGLVLTMYKLDSPLLSLETARVSDGSPLLFGRVLGCPLTASIFRATEGQLCSATHMTTGSLFSSTELTSLAAPAHSFLRREPAVAGGGLMGDIFGAIDL